MKLHYISNYGIFTHSIRSLYIQKMERFQKLDNHLLIYSTLSTELQYREYIPLVKKNSANSCAHIKRDLENELRRITCFSFEIDML